LLVTHAQTGVQKVNVKRVVVDERAMQPRLAEGGQKRLQINQLEPFTEALVRPQTYLTYSILFLAILSKYSQSLE
jgi:hypothetical protein